MDVKGETMIPSIICISHFPNYLLLAKKVKTFCQSTITRCGDNTIVIITINNDQECIEPVLLVTHRIHTY